MRKQAGWTAMAVAAAVTLMMAGSGPAFAAERTAPDSDSWQYFEAVETGNLPSQVMVKQDPKKGWERTGGFDTVDLGGISYRIGLDTN